ncbi:MAG: hypothetical protein M1274_15610 [Actinobacteria bacterium]|nr:hypothetical protein [Actinomycetota bacterium]
MLHWGWGWASVVGSIIVLGVFLIPWFLFLLNLSNLLERVDPRNRAMPPAYVWLNFILIFNLGWFIYTVIKVRDSVRDEYAARGWAPDGDFGYSLGFAAGVLGIVSFFFGWIPLVGWLIVIADVICWIIYWLKTSELKMRLGRPGIWQSGGPQAYPGGPPTYPGGPPSYPGGSQGYPGPQSYGGAQGYGGQPGYGPQGGAPFVPPVGAPPYGGQQQWSGGPGGQQQPQHPQQPQAEEPPLQPFSESEQPIGPEETSAKAGEAAGEFRAGGEHSGEEQPPAEARLGGSCAACGTSYDPTDVFCRTCGLKLP